jgi:5-methylcytosine-specific restriction protein A
MKKYLAINTPAGRAAFYKTAEWKLMREIVLRENPYCVTCEKEGLKTLAVAVDHIIDIKDAPGRILDRSNLQGLCTSCHAKKTFEENNPKGIGKNMEPVNTKWVNLNEVINYVNLEKKRNYRKDEVLRNLGTVTVKNDFDSLEEELFYQ